MRVSKYCFMVILTGLVLAGTLFGQSVTGVLTGTVTTEGSPLPGVTVTISSPALQGTRTTVTNENGAYNFQAIPPGKYTVVFELTGLQTVTKTVNVNLAQTSRADANLRVSAVAEAITVTASSPSVLETTDVSTNFSQSNFNELPTQNRNVQEIVRLAPGVSPEGPNDQPMISGAPSYENLYLVNGAVVNDSIRGQPEAVYIEDAIQETTIITGNVSAEYGRFTGGVVSAITKSGGNEFSGSLRDTLTNDSWTNKTPYPGEPEPADKLNEVYEGTFGGRLIRDRLWFFTAGRYRETTSTSSTIGTDIPFDRSDEEKRWEAKLTGQITDKHSAVISYLDRKTTQVNNSFGSIVDLRSLTNRELPNTLLSATYNGILTKNLLLEALYSKREFAFVGGGASSTDRIEGTILRDISTSRRAWSPTFCGVCSDKTRDNEYWLLKSSYFLSTGSLGSHNLIAGYETFAEKRNENNEQGGSGYRLWGNFIYQGQDVFIEVVPGTSFIQNWPVQNLSKTSDAATDSLFVNDRWDLNTHWSFNLGLRYDKNDSVDQAGNKTSDDSAVSPRLGLTWDVLGNGRHRVFAGYNRYVSKIDNGVNDDTSNAGSPAYYGYVYNGPAINEGSGPYLPTDQVLQMVFAWFDSIGGDNATPDRGVSLPGVNVQLAPGQLTSPTMDEASIGYGVQIGSRAFLRADYINRRWKDFYVDITNQQTGTVKDAIGNTFDLTLIDNSDAGLDRKYDALQLQGSWRPWNRVTVGGNYTWSELKGNADSETSNNATITLTSTNSYPEYISSAWNNPDRYLPGDVRNRAQAWVQYDLPTPIGKFNFSLLERYNSGFPYYAVGSVDLRTSATGIVNPGYINPPTSASYYFLDKGVSRTDDVTRTDLGINYSLPVFGRAQVFVEGDILNLFDEDAIADPTFVRTTVYTSRNSQCLQGSNGPSPGKRCLTFNPLTTAPVEGIHYQLHPDFGKAVSASAYQLPLTYQVSLGIRF